MKMNKLLTIALVGVLGCGVFACAQSPVAPAQEKVEEGNAHAGEGIMLTNLSHDEATQKTGLNLIAPEGATDVHYSVIEPDSDNPTIEMNFTLNGKDMYVRAQRTALLPPKDPTNKEELEKYNISGLKLEWNQMSSCDVSYSQGFAFINNANKAGYISWLDVVPGVLYSLGMEHDADIDTLQQTANLIFAPVKGNGDC